MENVDKENKRELYQNAATEILDKCEAQMEDFENEFPDLARNGYDPQAEKTTDMAVELFVNCMKRSKNTIEKLRKVHRDYV